ncbi:MAG TPA: hypothetical protein VN137_10020 [Sphingomonas sp.]|nr:hypothetical protein [Sphingomonas sp.]
MQALMILGVATLVAFLFCFVRMVVDLRARRFGWATAGLIVSGLLLWGCLTPVETHAVKVDLPGNR